MLDHMTFRVADAARTRSFCAAAPAAGGRDSGASGPRPRDTRVHDDACGIDPDRYGVEAACRAPA
jgi:hypothetical protein